MILNRSSFLKTMLLTLSFFIVTYWVWGFYYEEVEVIFDAFYSGKLSPGVPFPSWYYMAHIGISYLYAPLYQISAQVNWIAWIEYLYMLTACSILLFIAHHLLSPKLPQWAVYLVLLFIYVVVMADNVYHLQFTRVSYFMCAACLLGIIFLYKDMAAIRYRPWGFILLNLLFVIGTLTRLESAMEISLLLCAFGLFYQRGLIHTLRTLSFPLLIVSLVFGGIMYDIQHTSSFYKKVEPDIETQLTVRHNYIPLSEMKTMSDSIRYKAAVGLLWADPDVITVPFLRSLIKKGTPFLRDPLQWKRTKKSIVSLGYKYWFIIALNAFMGLSYFLFIAGYRRQRLFFLFFQTSFIALVIAQTYFVKINDRSFAPYLSIFTLVNLFVAFTIIETRRYVFVITFIFLCTAAWIGQTIVISCEAVKLKTEQEAYQEDIEQIKRTVGPNILVLNTSSFRFMLLAGLPFRSFDFSSFDRVYINEAQVLSTIDSYRLYLNKECSCDVDDFSNFFRYLDHSEKRVFFLSSQPRMALIRDYLKAIHHYDLDICEVPGQVYSGIYDHEHAKQLELKLYTFARANKDSIGGR